MSDKIEKLAKKVSVLLTWLAPTAMLMCADSRPDCCPTDSLGTARARQAAACGADWKGEEHCITLSRLIIARSGFLTAERNSSLPPSSFLLLLLLSPPSCVAEEALRHFKVVTGVLHRCNEWGGGGNLSATGCGNAGFVRSSADRQGLLDH